jgi:23S rRNA (guanosine2251-2'-O)-methyltransferase
MKSKNQTESILILPDIRSAINVGSIFRTADGVGVGKIYLTGYTPRPTDTFGRIQKDIAKSALGAEGFVPWEYTEKLLPLIARLKKKGYTVIALEQDARAVDYRKVAKLLSASTKILQKGTSEALKVAIILGPEVTGLDKKVLDACDLITYIPMYGKKESLNVSVACGVALFRILRA